MAEGFTIAEADDDTDGDAPAGPNGKRREHVPVFGRDFRVWIIRRYFAEYGAGLSGPALADVTRLAEARALGGGESHVTFRRWALGNAGCLYLDLGDADAARERRAVRITPDGWEVIEEAPIAFFNDELRVRRDG
jgi:hypothetical protein